MTEQQTPYVKEFPLREAHHLVRDLMTPNPWIYWIDFLFHITLGWAAFFVALFSPLFSGWQLGGFVVAVLALYRSAIFVHELAHLKKGTFKNFRLVWNAICGIPMMIPSFTYDGVHNDHHKPDVYGTSRDGEYLPFATRKPSEMVVYVLLSFLIPVLLAARFLLLTPLSYLIPPLRRIVWERASSLTIDPTYRREENAIRNDLNWQRQELGTCLFATTIVGLVALEVFPFAVLVLWYLIAVVIFILNSLRTLAAHAYRNPGEHKMTLAEQYLDSVNVPGNFLITPLWAPVGLRFHATHHLFMSMPYHNLGKAQRRLVKNLTDNSQYIRTLRSGLWPALRQIWRESSEASAAQQQQQQLLMQQAAEARAQARQKITQLVLVRHGQSIWNRDKKFTGWSDVPLSPEGEKEAEQVAQLLKQENRTFDLCFSSTLQRARTTAQIILSAMPLNIPIIENWRLNERHYGALEDMGRWEAIKAFGIRPVLDCQIWFDAAPPRLNADDPRFPGNQACYAGIDNHELPLGESMQQTVARLEPYWLNTIRPELQQGKRILIVSHRNTLRALMMLLDHLTPAQVMRQKLATGRPLVYELDQQLNVVRHYYMDGQA